MKCYRRKRGERKDVTEGREMGGRVLQKEEVRGCNRRKRGEMKCYRRKRDERKDVTEGREVRGRVLRKEER